MDDDNDGMNNRHRHHHRQYQHNHQHHQYQQQFGQPMFDNSYGGAHGRCPDDGLAFLLDHRRRRYSEKNYKKLLQTFVRQKGYDTVKGYVYGKFSRLLDQTVQCHSSHSHASEMRVVAGELAAAPRSLPTAAGYSKRYMENIPKRYHVTKQQFLEADFTRNVFGQRYAFDDAAGDDNDECTDRMVYSEPYAHCVSTMPNMRAANRRRQCGTSSRRHYAKKVPPMFAAATLPPKRLSFRNGDPYGRQQQRFEHRRPDASLPLVGEVIHPDWYLKAPPPLKRSRSFPSLWCSRRSSAGSVDWIKDKVHDVYLCKNSRMNIHIRLEIRFFRFATT